MSVRSTMLTAQQSYLLESSLYQDTAITFNMITRQGVIPKISAQEVIRIVEGASSKHNVRISELYHLQPKGNSKISTISIIYLGNFNNLGRTVADIAEMEDALKIVSIEVQSDNSLLESRLLRAQLVIQFIE
jgi:hypothetical protein